jgi:hypothetical protein
VFSVVEAQMCSRVGSYQYFEETFASMFMAYYNSDDLKIEIRTIILNLFPET